LPHILNKASCYTCPCVGFCVDLNFQFLWVSSK
jgi:hypothetical protein